MLSFTYGSQLCPSSPFQQGGAYARALYPGVREAARSVHTRKPASSSESGDETAGDNREPASWSGGARAPRNPSGLQSHFARCVSGGLNAPEIFPLKQP